MKLTEHQAEACQALLKALSVTDNHESNWMEDVDVKFFDHDQDDFQSEELFDNPDDEVNDNACSLFSDDTPFLLTPNPAGELAENTIQKCLLELLLSLFTHLPTGREDKFWSPILRFIVLYSIKKDGRWLDARQITQVFAALLFCG
jgi:hypothetical protein